MSETSISAGVSEILCVANKHQFPALLIVGAIIVITLVFAYHFLGCNNMFWKTQNPLASAPSTPAATSRFASGGASDANLLYTGPGGALENACMTDPGRDTTNSGGCGAAWERFSAGKKHHMMKSSHFLTDRGSGPEFWDVNQATIDALNGAASDDSTGGDDGSDAVDASMASANAAQAAAAATQTAVQAVQSGAIAPSAAPAVAAQAASSFAAQKMRSHYAAKKHHMMKGSHFTADDALLAKSRGQ